MSGFTFQSSPKKPRLKGFAALIGNLVNNVKETDECKEMIKGMKTRVLLNNKEGKWAALITIINNQITVEGIKNEPKENISRKKLKWWGFWEFPNLQSLMTARDWGAYKWIFKTAGGKGVKLIRYSKTLFLKHLERRG